MSVAPVIELKVVIPDEVYQKIMWWIHKSNHEVSGFGSLDFDQATGIFTVRDAILLKQHVGPAMTEIDPVSLGKAMYEQRNEVNALKWHWHSHVDMGVFWSADDQTLIRNLGSQGWIVASVFNKKREIKSAFFTMMDIGIMGTVKKQELFLDDIPSSIKRYIAKDLCDQWDKEYSEHVSVRSLPAARSYETNYWQPGNFSKPGFVAKATRDIKNLPVNGSSYSSAEYNHSGFKWSYAYKKWVYNPMYDLSVNSDAAIIQGVLTMDKEEIEVAFTYWKDRTFQFAIHYKDACNIQKPLFGDDEPKTEAAKPGFTEAEVTEMLENMQ